MNFLNEKFGFCTVGEKLLRLLLMEYLCYNHYSGEASMARGVSETNSSVLV